VAAFALNESASNQANSNAGLTEALMAHHGRAVRTPQRPERKPKAAFLDWHGREVFKGAPRHHQMRGDRINRNTTFSLAESNRTNDIVSVRVRLPTTQTEAV